MTAFADLMESGRSTVRSLPLEKLQKTQIFIDRVNDNPEAPRHFIAFGDWGPLEPEEVFANLDPETKRQTLVYLDFPFCKRVCNFCAFYPVIARGEDSFTNYFDGVLREIELLEKAYFATGGAKVETVELGGGTPTVTPLPQLRAVVDAVFERFAVDPRDEHSFEATPDSIATEEGFAKLRYLRERGFSRISLGVQSFDDSVLKSMNRSHASQDIPVAVKNIRTLGFERINFDIMLGVPNQPVQDFLESIERALELEIEILELYTMRYFDTRKLVPVARRLATGSAVAEPDEILAARIAADEMLRAAGYSSANGRTYQKCKQDYFSNYFLGNFQGTNLLGIGRKSHSNLYPYQYANYLNIDKYLAHLNAGALPIGAGCKFEVHARLGKLLTGALQLPGVLDLDALKTATGAGASTRFDGMFQQFVELDLLEERGPRQYEKTLLGFLFVEEMMKVVFDACVKPFTTSSTFLGQSQVGSQRTQTELMP